MNCDPSGSRCWPTTGPTGSSSASPVPATTTGRCACDRAADGGVELHVEAFLGDASIAALETRALHPVMIVSGPSAPDLLAHWAGEVGRAAHAHVTAPYQLGWCSWYQYFDHVTEPDVRANLKLARPFEFEVFQLDDGYQPTIGNWLDANYKFPSGLPTIAGAIQHAGYQPGIWLAPFLVAPDAPVAHEHPDWLAQFRSPAGNVYPLHAWWNPSWHGGQDGYMYALDTTNPDVQDHLEHVARTLVGYGFTYLKLDFTFAPSMDGIWSDPTQTPAQRVRAGFDAIRRGAGPDAFLLGCGAPLSHVVGVVDGNRIGPDVAPVWTLDAAAEAIPGYLRTQPATRFALEATVARSFMHRRLWLNDPDCVMLRTTETQLTARGSRDMGAHGRALGRDGGGIGQPRVARRRGADAVTRNRGAWSQERRRDDRRIRAAAAGVVLGDASLRHPGGGGGGEAADQRVRPSVGGPALGARGGGIASSTGSAEAQDPRGEVGHGATVRVSGVSRLKAM